MTFQEFVTTSLGELDLYATGLLARIKGKIVLQPSINETLPQLMFIINCTFLKLTAVWIGTMGWVTSLDHAWSICKFDHNRNQQIRSRWLPIYVDIDHHHPGHKISHWELDGRVSLVMWLSKVSFYWIIGQVQYLDQLVGCLIYLT